MKKSNLNAQCWLVKLIFWCWSSCIYSFSIMLVNIFSSSFLELVSFHPFRLLLSQHSGLRGLCAFLCGDGGPLLPLHGRGGAGRRVLVLAHLTQPLFFLLPLLPLVLSAWGLSQSGHFQELEEVSGGVHGDSDVYRLHPGEGAAQTGPQRYKDLIDVDRFNRL